MNNTIEIEETGSVMVFTAKDGSTDIVNVRNDSEYLHELTKARADGRKFVRSEAVNFYEVATEPSMASSVAA